MEEKETIKGDVLEKPALKPGLLSGSENNSEDIWSGFYKKTLPSRRDQLQLMFPGLPPPRALSEPIADNMVENCIGTMSLPLGLALNFKINGQPIIVPMATEEPSIIAAVSGAAKTISQNGGFSTEYSGNIMVGQVQLLDLEDVEAAAAAIRSKKDELMDFGNQFCQSMKKRKGGLVDITVRVLPFNKKVYYGVYKKNGDTIESEAHRFVGEITERESHKMVVVHCHIDVCESMGANTVNTVAEGIAPKLLDIVGGRVGLRIVTNFCVERRAKASFMIPVSKLGYKNLKGEDVARKIMEGYGLAKEDPYRAVTHNKGIMNGIDAVAIALGQDFRAIESGAHAWATRNGRYEPLTQYKLIEENDLLYLFGYLEIPTPIGVRGGAIQSHPTMQYTHALMNNPSCATLAEVLAMVGLTQNFAALRAMVSEGIQRGHMSLHARNIAIQAGAPPILVPEVAAYMVTHRKISLATASEYLKAHSIMTDGRMSFYTRQMVLPSTLLVEFEMEVPVSINIVFESLGTNPVHLAIQEGRKPLDIQRELFGGDKDVTWFKMIFALLGKLQVANKAPRRSNLIWQYKVKVLSILMNLLLFRLIDEDAAATRQLIQNILFQSLDPLLFIKQLKAAKEVFVVGAPLFCSLFSIFKHEVDQQISVRALANALKEEQLRVFSSAINMIDLQETAKDFEQFLSVHSRRYQVTVFLLCDLISINPNLITPASLRFMLLLGNYLEMEGVICHDLAYWGKAGGGNNAYQFWLKIENKVHNDKTPEEFMNVTRLLSQEKKDKLLADSSAAPFFDISLFIKETTDVVQQYYEIMEIMLQAKL